MIGIYKITNKINGRAYIGQSKNIGTRWSNHINRLECKKHENKELQKGFNNFGYFNFSFEIIEECQEKELLSVELKYINLYQGNSYNITSNSNSTLYVDNFKFNKHININLNYNILSQRVILTALKKYYERNTKEINIACSDIMKEYDFDHSIYYKGIQRIYDEISHCELFEQVLIENSSIFNLKFNEQYYFLAKLFYDNNIIDSTKNFIRRGSLNLYVKILCNKLKLYYHLEDFKREYNINELPSYKHFSNIKRILLIPMIEEIELVLNKNIIIDEQKERGKIVGFNIITSNTLQETHSIPSN